MSHLIASIMMAVGRVDTAPAAAAIQVTDVSLHRATAAVAASDYRLIGVLVATQPAKHYTTRSDNNDVYLARQCFHENGQRLKFSFTCIVALFCASTTSRVQARKIKH